MGWRPQEGVRGADCAAPQAGPQPPCLALLPARAAAALVLWAVAGGFFLSSLLGKRRRKGVKAPSARPGSAAVPGVSPHSPVQELLARRLSGLAGRLCALQESSHLSQVCVKSFPSWDFFIRSS